MHSESKDTRISVQDFLGGNRGARSRQRTQSLAKQLRDTSAPFAPQDRRSPAQRARHSLARWGLLSNVASCVPRDAALNLGGVTVIEEVLAAPKAAACVGQGIRTSTQDVSPQHHLPSSAQGRKLQYSNNPAAKARSFSYERLHFYQHLHPISRAEALKDAR